MPDGHHRPAPVGLVLTMIVRDEEHVLRRCLEAALPIIDAACIVDTGSADATVDIARRFIDRHGLRGRVFERPWSDFATNRTQAIDLSRPWGTHSLMIDADDVLSIDADTTADQVRAQITHDVHHIEIQHESFRYSRPLISCTAMPFRYRGVLHEYLEIGPHVAVGRVLRNVRVLYGADGRRSREPNTFRRDAEVLEAALERGDEPDLRPRYTFYAARCWRDAGHPWRALHRFEERTRLGGWAEEVQQSWLSIGHLLQQLGRPVGEVLRAYEQARFAAPWRAEAGYYAASAARRNGQADRAAELARGVVDLVEPDSSLFGEPWIYRWGTRLELALAMFDLGRVDEASRLARALQSEHLGNDPSMVPDEVVDLVRHLANPDVDRGDDGAIATTTRD